MKKISIAMLAVATMIATSCSDYLDINTNPNQPTTVQPALVMSQALVGTALVENVFTAYGLPSGGYAANAGGFGGFNEQTTYIYTNNNYAGNWPAGYDNASDYQYIINNTIDADGNVLPDQIYFNAVARIMKSNVFQMLVDAYNDVPYSEAFLGDANLTPAYDKAQDVYAALAVDLDLAIAEIRAGQAAAIAPVEITSYDVVFGLGRQANFAAEMENWVKLANTIKLRLIVRAGGKVTFANQNFDPTGFLTTDAVINPGYARDNNRENPNFNSYGFNYQGSSASKAWLPSTFVFGFYNGYKLNDPGRGAAMYYQFPLTGTNQLGFEGTNIPKSPEGNNWLPLANRDGKSAGNTTGALKGPDAGMVLMLAAESYFLQAEAALEGIFPGDDKALFESGIKASFEYLYKRPDGTYAAGADADGDAADYISSNNSYLTQYNLATTDAQKLEAIITQKWIAMNMVTPWEGYNEYRRTGYPKISGTSPTSTFASIESLVSNRPDRLPTRILYPTTEIQYNGANVPQGITSTNALIFWAQ